MASANTPSSGGGRRSWRRFFRYGTRTLLALMTFTAILLAREIRMAQGRSRAFDELEKLARCSIGPAEPKTLLAQGRYALWSKVVDPARLRSVLDVSFFGSAIGDAEVELLAHFPEVVRLSVSSSRVTDRGMQAIAALPNLRTLRIKRAAISDNGLASLAGSELTDLVLADVNINGSGFAAFDADHSLESLTLTHTHLDDQGFAALARLKNIAALGISDAHLTGATIGALEDRKWARPLYISIDRATDESIAAANPQAVFEHVQIGGEGVTDVSAPSLTTRFRAKKVTLVGTRVSAQELAGMKRPDATRFEVRRSGSRASQVVEGGPEAGVVEQIDYVDGLWDKGTVVHASDWPGRLIETPGTGMATSVSRNVLVRPSEPGSWCGNSTPLIPDMPPRLEFWDMASMTCRVLANPFEGLQSLAVSEDGRCLVVSSYEECDQEYDCVVRMIDLSDSTALRVVWQAKVDAAWLALVGERVLVVDESNYGINEGKLDTLTFLDAADGHVCGKKEVRLMRGMPVACDPIGRRILVQSGDRNLTLYSGPGLNRQRKFQVQCYVQSADLVPDGDEAVLQDLDGRLLLVDLRRRTQTPLAMHSMEGRLAVSPRRVVSYIGDDHRARLIDFAEPTKAYVLDSLPLSVWSVEFSAAGQTAIVRPWGSMCVLVLPVAELLRTARVVDQLADLSQFWNTPRTAPVRVARPAYDPDDPFSDEHSKAEAAAADPFDP